MNEQVYMWVWVTHEYGGQRLALDVIVGDTLFETVFMLAWSSPIWLVCLADKSQDLLFLPPQSWDHTPSHPSGHDFSVISLPLTLRQRFKEAMWLHQLTVPLQAHRKCKCFTYKTPTAKGRCALAEASLRPSCSPVPWREQGTETGRHSCGLLCYE